MAADVLKPEQRRRNMQAIRGGDTRPEMIVRRTVHRMGFRYRLHRRDLPGTPDLVFPKHRKVVFVHGCFWHVHDCKFGRVMPATNEQFWSEKRRSNVDRDARSLRELAKDGWKPLVVWECTTRDHTALVAILSEFLHDDRGQPESPITDTSS